LPYTTCRSPTTSTSRSTATVAYGGKATRASRSCSSTNTTARYRSRSSSTCLTSRGQPSSIKAVHELSSLPRSGSYPILRATNGTSIQLDNPIRQGSSEAGLSSFTPFTVDSRMAILLPLRSATSTSPTRGTFPPYPRFESVFGHP